MKIFEVLIKKCISNFNMIKYQEILNKNLLKVFIEILKDIEKNGLSGSNHLYVTFATNTLKNSIPKWLIEKYPTKMTIVVQNEYYHLMVKKDHFKIGLSFNNTKTDLIIFFKSIISFVDPSANFGLSYQFNVSAHDEKKQIIKKDKENLKKKIKSKNSSNIISFSKYKKN